MIPIKYNIRAKYAKKEANPELQLPSKINLIIVFVVIKELRGISLHDSQ